MGFMKRIFSVLLFCACFCASAAYEDYIKNFENDTERAKREEQERIAKERSMIDLMERRDEVASDELLFVEKNEMEEPEDVSKNRLNAYFSKELGVDGMDQATLDTVLKIHFGDGVSYDDALTSLKHTKRWGSQSFEPTKLELEKYKAGFFEEFGFALIVMLAMVALMICHHKMANGRLTANLKMKNAKKRERNALKKKKKLLEKQIADIELQESVKAMENQLEKQELE